MFYGSIEKNVDCLVYKYIASDKGVKGKLPIYKFSFLEEIFKYAWIFEM